MHRQLSRTVAILLTKAAIGVAVAAPPVPGTAPSPPPAPDYTQTAAWAARPGEEGAASAVPPNATPAADPDRTRADVFYVHPTTFKNPTLWNQPIADAATNAWTDESVVSRQAGLFNVCCRVFAPRYRQAEIRSFTAMDGEGGRAYDLAYRDVLRAFDDYIARDNHGRPFILVGHSQGAFHVMRLLKERVDRPPLADQLVAAYVIGIGLHRGEFGWELKTLRPCEHPRQTRCVLGWNSWLAGSDTDAFAHRGIKSFEAVHGPGTAGPLLCTNPMNLDGRRHRSGAGTLPPSKGWMLPPLLPRVATAACDADGVLQVKLDPAVALRPLPGGNMHYHDLALFYAEIRADAARRVAAFR